jgi:long-chain acyl-CoA synthetase
VGPVPEGRMAEDTFPKLLLRNAQRFAERPAMREKDLGIWQVWTWAEMRDEIAAFSIGLSTLGFARGDKVAIVGANRPQLYWTFCAVQSLGGVPVPVYKDAVAEEMAFVLNHAEVRFAVVEDQEQVDKLLSLSDRLPKLEHVIYEDDAGWPITITAGCMASPRCSSAAATPSRPIPAPLSAGKKRSAPARATTSR